LSSLTSFAIGHGHKWLNNVAFGIQMYLVDDRVISLFRHVPVLSVHQILKESGHPRQQQHVAVIAVLHFAMYFPPELSGIHNNLGAFTVHVPAQGLSDVAQDDALPVAIRHIALLLDFLQAFNVSQVNAMKAMCSGRAPREAVDKSRDKDSK
jgi:hypothetical protein